MEFVISLLLLVSLSMMCMMMSMMSRDKVRAAVALGAKR